MADIDEFEAKNMRVDDAPLLHHDKKVSRALAIVLSLVGLLVIALSIYTGVANATASRPVPPAALPFVVAGVALLGLGFIALGLTLSVVRTLVTSREVNVKYGLWGPRIPMSAISSCRAIDYDWTEFGGFGIRYARGTWAYVPEGPRVVEIKYVENGKEKRVLVDGGDADATVNAINRARASAAEVRHLRIEDASQPSLEEAAAREEAERTERAQR